MRRVAKTAKGIRLIGTLLDQATRILQGRYLASVSLDLKDALLKP